MKFVNCWDILRGFLITCPGAISFCVGALNTDLDHNYVMWWDVPSHRLYVLSKHAWIFYYEIEQIQCEIFKANYPNPIQG